MINTMSHTFSTHALCLNFNQDPGHGIKCSIAQSRIFETGVRVCVELVKSSDDSRSEEEEYPYPF